MFLINPYVFGGGGASVPDAVSFWNADNSTDDAFGANNATLVMVQHITQVAKLIKLLV